MRRALATFVLRALANGGGRGADRRGGPGHRRVRLAGIGTSSRKLPASLGGYTVGALVQTSYGGILTINGAPVGRELGQYIFKRQPEEDARGPGPGGDGSCMIVIATDAPLDARNLERLAKRAVGAMVRTGSPIYKGSGDYVIAFSTAASVRRPIAAGSPEPSAGISNDAASPVFLAAVEATEEAIYSAMFKTTTVKGFRGTYRALPIDSTLAALRKHDVLNWNEALPPRRSRRPFPHPGVDHDVAVRVETVRQVRGTRDPRGGGLAAAASPVA